MMSNKRILIVDDDKFILRFFTLILQRREYSTDTAETGKEALEKISSGQFYDVALIDVILPDTNGLDLLKKIHPKTKKIVMTGTTSEQNQKRAQTEGAHAYLQKPIKPETLLHIIAN